MEKSYRFDTETRARLLGRVSLPRLRPDQLAPGDGEFQKKYFIGSLEHLAKVDAFLRIHSLPKSLKLGTQLRKEQIRSLEIHLRKAANTLSTLDDDLSGEMARQYSLSSGQHWNPFYFWHFEEPETFLLDPLIALNHLGIAAEKIKHDFPNGRWSVLVSTAESVKLLFMELGIPFTVSNMGPAADCLRAVMQFAGDTTTERVDHLLTKARDIPSFSTHQRRPFERLQRRVVSNGCGIEKSYRFDTETRDKLLGIASLPPLPPDQFAPGDDEFQKMDFIEGLERLAKLYALRNIHPQFRPKLPKLGTQLRKEPIRSLEIHLRKAANTLSTLDADLFGEMARQYSLSSGQDWNPFYFWHFEEPSRLSLDPLIALKHLAVAAEKIKHDFPKDRWCMAVSIAQSLKFQFMRLNIPFTVSDTGPAANCLRAVLLLAGDTTVERVDHFLTKARDIPSFFDPPTPTEKNL